MLIYPAIDIYQGKCVRLKRGDFAAQTVYSDSPVEVARAYLDAGLTFLHIVDLDGAKEGRRVNQDALAAILQLPGIRAQVGGGIRDRSDITSLLDAGATRVIVSSVAVNSPHLVRDWVREFGLDRFVVAADIRGGVVAHRGWLERANLTPSIFIETMKQAGVINFLCTDIDRDGMLAGPNLQLYSSLEAEFPSLQFIASGGVSQLSDVENLRTAGCAGVVVGKALYEGHVTAEELTRFSRQ
jgi:phosphoribosylformimino-5-aminoimidazole carboxamide ribotide isomerase